MENTKRVTELDFVDIKSNLVDYLSQQSTLKDFNYEGSALSTLVNVLAYNTHYNAIIANMMGNEMFLDSALSRASIISKAKELNYTPRSKTCPIATVNIEVRNVSGNPSTTTLPKNTKFTTSIDGISYSFITNASYIANNVSNVYTFSGIKLYEGILSTSSFIMSTTGQNLFTIPTENVDIDTIKVIVQNSQSDLRVEQYIKCTDITQISGTDAVFFIQAHENNYQIYFGDNIIGKKPNSGAVIIVEYISTNGANANGAKVFSRFGSTTIGGSSNIVINTTIAAIGGKNAESTYDIKFNAPKAYTTQNRMVTSDDYKFLIQRNVSNVKSISVWGGEDNVPPDYGSVYICIEPETDDYLTDNAKQDIISYVINSKKMIGIRPKIVDPMYIYMKINSTVYYNSNLTSQSPIQLSNVVTNTIKAYNDNNLEKFDGVFRYSALSKNIDNTDPSIVSNITTISMHQYLVPVFGMEIGYTIKFNNPIYQNEFKTAENSFRSSRGFRITGDSKTYYFEDDGNQYIKLFYYDGSTKIHTKSNIGTIDYTNGIVNLNKISISSIDYVNSDDIGLEIVAVPMSNDIIPIMNSIIKIKDSDITVNALIDPISSGYNASGTKYIFTESR